MSQIQRYDVTTALADIETLTADNAVAVGPDGAGNVDIVGGSNITTVGNAGANTLTIDLNSTVSITGSFTAGTGVTVTNGDVIIGNTAASTAAPNIEFAKSRGGGVITSGDDLGQIVFQGHDGGALEDAAAILSTSSGTIGADRVPANLEFYTHADAPGNPIQRMVIDTTGEVTVNAPDSGTGLTIAGGGLTTTGTTTLASLSNGTLVVDGTGIVSVSTNLNVIATAQTVDATETTLFSLVVAASSSVTIRAILTAAKADYSAAVMMVGTAATGRGAAGAARPLIKNSTNQGEDSGTGNPSIKWDLSGSTIRLRVTGEGGITYNWRARIDYEVQS